MKTWSRCRNTSRRAIVYRMHFFQAICGEQGGDSMIQL